jgi:hypothetical protein
MAVHRLSRCGVTQCSHLLAADQRSATGPEPTVFLADILGRLPSTEISEVEVLIGEPLLSAGCDLQSFQHEAILYRQARAVPGIHLLLRQNPRVPTVGGRDVAVLPSLPALRTPDDLGARSEWPDRANTGQARSIRLLIPREDLPDLVPTRQRFPSLDSC